MSLGLSVTHSCLLSFFISFDVFRSCVCNVSGWKKIRALQMVFLCVAVFGTCFIGSDLEDIAEAYKNLSHCAQAPQKRTYTKPSK